MMKAVSNRIAVSLLAMSASALIGLVVSEGYVGEAMIPTKGDRPTIGFGSTKHEDGSAVKIGDKTTPVRALIKAHDHISKEEQIFRDSLPGVELHQAEYDLYMDWVYQYGRQAWMDSSMRKHLLNREYKAACDALLEYRFMTSATPIDGWEPYRYDANGKPTRWRFDCSTPGNKICRGVWTRQLERNKKCLEVQ